VINKCEIFMGCHDPNMIQTMKNHALMPESWKRFGTSEWSEPLFTYAIILPWLLATITVGSYIGLSFW
jgi:hypothetical protein